MPERNPLGTKEQIIAVARRHFAHLGFHKVTMNEIAREVGMGKASLYYYIPTKQALFREVVLNEQEVFLADLREILARMASAKCKFQAYVESRYAFMNRLLHLNILDVAGSENMRPMLRKIFDDFVSREIRLVAAIVESGVQRNEFSDPSPHKTAETFVHCIQGLRLRFVRRAGNATVDVRDYRKLKPEITLLTEMFIRGLRNKRA
jgi:TetR/AcrR family transcriptional regulator